MPTYTFMNTKTNEIYDDIMSYSDMLSLLEHNPHIKKIIQPPKFADPTRIDGARGKPDDAFRDRLKEIKKAHSGGLRKSTINTW